MAKLHRVGCHDVPERTISSKSSTCLHCQLEDAERSRYERLQLRLIGEASLFGFLGCHGEWRLSEQHSTIEVLILYHQQYSCYCRWQMLTYCSFLSEVSANLYGLLHSKHVNFVAIYW